MSTTSKFFISISLVFILALAMPAAAEVVQSSGITLDPAAVDHTNPPGTVVTGIWDYSGSPTQPDETFIDDLSVQTAGGGRVGLTIEIIPVTTPVVIPPFTFYFNMTITDPLYGQIFDVWWKVRLPNGRLYGNPPVRPPSLTHSIPSGYWTSSLPLQQDVPPGAPAGAYTYIGYVGTYPGTIDDSSYFPFTKMPLAGGSVVTTWDNAEAAAPTDFTLNNYPNPFNPTTTISYTLPLSGNASLTVYDLRGRQVVQLVNGYHEAGSYQVTFDGAALSSGVYLYRLQNAEQVLNGKMVLMK